MARRALSPDEVKALGLPEAPAQQPVRRALSADEVAAVGLPAPSVPAPEKPGAVEAAGRGLAQGGTFGLSDEITGAIQAYGDNALRNIDRIKNLDFSGVRPASELERLMKVYRENRDAARREDAAAKAAHGTAYNLGEFAGGAATSAALPVGTASAVLQGAASGLGHSTSDTVVGDVGNAALGGALGYAGDRIGAGIGKAANYVGGKVAGFAGQKAAEAEAKAAGMAAAKTQAALASMRGELGAATQDANRAMEVLTSHLSGSLTPAQQAQQAALEQSGVLPALKEKLADSVLAKIPGAAANIDAKRLAYETAMANRQAATDATKQAILSGGEAKRQVMERLQRYAPPIIGTMLGSTAGAGVGLALGGDKADAALGALGGAGMRPALWAMRRMVQHPSVQHAAATTIQTIATQVPHLMGEYAPVLTAAMARGPGALAVQDYLLSQKDPAYREKKDAAQKQLQYGQQP